MSSIALTKRLTITTAVLASLVSYGRRAYAACVPDPAPPTFTCTGDNNSTQIILAENATVTTAPGFSVSISDPYSHYYGVEILGTGQLSFTDENQSSIVGAGRSGLSVATFLDPMGSSSITIVSDGDIQGRDHGIRALDRDSGAISITVGGEVTGNSGFAIWSENQQGGSSYITITESGVLSGGVIGVYSTLAGTAPNSGQNKITVLGDVSGGVFGIYARNGINGNAGDLIIETGAESSITAGRYGIYANNSAQNTGGATKVAVNGDVTSVTNAAVQLTHYNSGMVEVTTGAGSYVRGAAGILASNNGEAGMTINIDGGEIIGTLFDGIMAYNNNALGATYLTLQIADGATVRGAVNGATLANDGSLSGATTITISGDVTGVAGNGLNITNTVAGTTTIIDVEEAGLVEGGLAGISSTGQAANITNDGLIRNISRQSFDRAISTSGGPVSLLNNADLIGTVGFGDGADQITNQGSWNTAGGENAFGGGADSLINEVTGRIIAASQEDVSELTSFLALETFDNEGTLTMQDNGTGDRTQVSGDFNGNSGVLAVDAVLGPGASGGASDRLLVSGNTSGTSRVFVNVVDATGANFEGIPVVEVEGTTADGHFELGAPVNGGFFAWDLQLDGTTHELVTTGIGVGAHEFAAGIGGAQEIWHQTTGTLLQRQADLRSLLGGVIPVADYAEPVSPTPVANITPGFWFKGVGAWLERDDKESGFTLDREQTIWGGLAGFDFGSQSTSDVWMFGLFGGYLTSDLEFDETNTEWNYEGPTVGVYATYLNDAFYADVTVKADFLNINIDPEDLAPASDHADTDALNIGGRIDTGYKFGHSVFIEPQASLAVLRTEIDDVEIFGGDVEFDDETNVRGRLGLRLGFDQPGSDGTVYSGDVIASVWEEFSGGNDVSITDPVFGTFGASDDAGGTYGDISLGFSVAAPEGWSAFIRGNYLFAGDYEAITGNAGVRYAW